MASDAAPTGIVDHWVLSMMESKRYCERVATGEVNVMMPTALIRESLTSRSRKYCSPSYSVTGLAYSPHFSLHTHTSSFLLS
jgi:hypothetical protein